MVSAIQRTTVSCYKILKTNTCSNLSSNLTLLCFEVFELQFVDKKTLLLVPKKLSLTWHYQKQPKDNSFYLKSRLKTSVIIINQIEHLENFLQKKNRIFLNKSSKKNIFCTTLLPHPITDCLSILFPILIGEKNAQILFSFAIPVPKFLNYSFNKQYKITFKLF